jgi:hypothetical protein
VVWSQWNQNQSYTYTITNSGVWTNWNLTYIYGPSGTQFNYTPISIAEVKAERQAEVAAWLKAEEEALARAERLLLSCLDEIQRDRFQKERVFEVIGRSRRRYLVEYGWAGNVKILDETGKAVTKLCIHPVRPVPVPDNLLAQKLMIETDEEQFLKTANHTRLAA